MKKFVADELGGVEVCNEYGKVLVRLNAEELKALYEIQQRSYDVQNVRDTIPDWVGKQLEDDNFFFEDFNSHLYSNDEISKEDIVQKILSDDALVQKIAEEYRDILDDPATEEGCQEWWYAEEAISTHVSIKDIMGEILREKYPKELLVGQWRVLLIEEGDLYGTEANRVPWRDSEPLVEFYDMYADKTRHPNGEFTTGRYYVDQLVHPGVFSSSLEQIADDGDSWMLHPIKEEWTVRAGDLNVISAWLKACYAHAKPSIEMRLAEAKEESQQSVAAGELGKTSYEFQK